MEKSAALWAEVLVVSEDSSVLMGLVANKGISSCRGLLLLVVFGQSVIEMLSHIG